MSTPHSVVGPVHFEDFSGVQFERLVFAYLLRMYPWRKLDWLGESGSEGGRDIWGELYAEKTGRRNVKLRSVCVQCKNERVVSLSTARTEIEKLVDLPIALPDEYWLVAGGRVSAKSREAIKELAKETGIEACQVMSGGELEERLRAYAESILEHFVSGVIFPDAPSDLVAFLQATPAKSAREALPIIARVFRRPAFHTPFRHEHDVSDLNDAIEDTIAALNTGVYRMRDGTIIGRIPSVYDLKDPDIATNLHEIVRDLEILRAVLDHLLGRSPYAGRLRSVAGLKLASLNWSNAPKVVDRLRLDILRKFRAIHPAFCDLLLESDDWV